MKSQCIEFITQKGRCLLRPPGGGVSEAHLRQAYKPCSIRAIPSQPYWNVSWWSPHVPTRGHHLHTYPKGCDDIA